ncbi:MAG: (d)CMP kinase [Clostridia bacterium]|nr:(d)CMP kinase [Clostridia bacterium]MBO4884799.1 (d)CMP kinase [Clostridia bacterium]
MSKHFAVAIDGPAGAGKSTVAKGVAQALNAIYLDTGAMYRAVGLYMLRQGVPLDDAALVAAHAPQALVDVRYVDGAQRVYLCGEDVSQAIRENAVSAAASAVSAVVAVRELMVARQREIAAGADVVMDGRDIGTKVLPDAPVKVFLTAAAEVRARRRFLELQRKGQEVPYEQLLSEIKERDHNDATRAASPMVQAADAVLLDSSDMTVDEVVSAIVGLAKQRMEERRA